MSEANLNSNFKPSMNFRQNPSRNTHFPSNGRHSPNQTNYNPMEIIYFMSFSHPKVLDLFTLKVWTLSRPMLSRRYLYFALHNIFSVLPTNFHFNRTQSNLISIFTILIKKQEDQIKYIKFWWSYLFLPMLYLAGIELLRKVIQI